MSEKSFYGLPVKTSEWSEWKVLPTALFLNRGHSRAYSNDLQHYPSTDFDSHSALPSAIKEGTQYKQKTMMLGRTAGAALIIVKIQQHDGKAKYLYLSKKVSLNRGMIIDLPIFMCNKIITTTSRLANSLFDSAMGLYNSAANEISEALDSIENSIDNRAKEWNDTLDKIDRYKNDPFRDFNPDE